MPKLARGGSGRFRWRKGERGAPSKRACHLSMRQDLPHEIQQTGQESDNVVLVAATLMVIMCCWFTCFWGIVGVQLVRWAQQMTSQPTKCFSVPIKKEATQKEHPQKPNAPISLAQGTCLPALSSAKPSTVEPSEAHLHGEMWMEVMQLGGLSGWAGEPSTLQRRHFQCVKIGGQRCWFSFCPFPNWKPPQGYKLRDTEKRPSRGRGGSPISFLGFPSPRGDQPNTARVNLGPHCKTVALCFRVGEL